MLYFIFYYNIYIYIKYVNERIKELKHKHDITYSSLKEMPNIRVRKGSGSIYLYPNIDWYINKKSKEGVVIENDNIFCIELLKKYQYIIIFVLLCI